MNLHKDSGSPAQRIAGMLATATLHHSPCGNGRLQWQQWSERETGPPLLLLHGGFGSWNHWFAAIERLRQERELWTLDMPGLGASADIFRRARPQHMAAIIAPAAKRLLASRSLDIAAFSFGAMVGAHLAAAVSCRRFFAIGAAGCGDLHVQVPLQALPRAHCDAEVASEIHRRNLRSLMFSAHFPIDDLAIQLQSDNLSRARFNSRPLSLTSGFIDALRTLPAQLTGIWGSEDATAGGESGIAKRRDIFANRQPGHAFHVLQGVGHWAMHEAPDAVVDILLTD
ncbi:MAG: alpha/beta hydrolase [Pseudomonadota bacterium]